MSDEPMPRNADRIPEILSILSEIWQANPDLRLAQLLYACIPEEKPGWTYAYRYPDGSRTKPFAPPVRRIDISFIEDDVILEGLKYHLKVVRNEPICVHCNGTGKGDDLHIECSDCDGTGKPVGFE